MAALSDGRFANIGARLGTEGVNRATGRAEIDFARAGPGLALQVSSGRRSHVLNRQGNE